MTTHNKNSPHHPRPQGQDLLKRDFKVEDAAGVVFGEHLTWDEAWKLKEQVAGARKSTTPAVRKMGANGVHPNARPAKPAVVPTWSDGDRATAVAKAAALATQQAEQQHHQIANAVPINEVELTKAEQDLIDDIIGDGDGTGDDDVDAAIAAAQAAEEQVL